MGLLDRLKTLFGGSTEPARDAVRPSPAQAPSGAALAPSDRRTRKRVDAREGTRVLIIDDSPTIVVALRKMLQSAGYVTLEAATGEQGVELARREQPDLIFLDIILPGIDGFAALRQMRRDQALRGVPVIMISGNEQATEQFYAQRIGADDFMKKPFSRFEVFARIERLLDPDLVPRRAPAISSAAAGE
ncbi:Alkaline phosphatase synthesis transcriptional regulatory protein PhoP [Burkholderiales bacterium]|nr:Alkaline phosphatase synthesis transcriptional regulatory protein PhoP [Burkholderiales bacterium]